MEYFSLISFPLPFLPHLPSAKVFSSHLKSILFIDCFSLRLKTLDAFLRIGNGSLGSVLAQVPPTI